MKKVLIGLVLILSSIGVAVADEVNTHTQTATKPLAANNIMVKTPRIQLVQDSAKSAEVFMDINNKGGLPVTLIAANSLTANQTFLQKIIERDGDKTLRKVNRIVIRPHSNTELQPGGLHVMLIGLKQTLQKGDSVPVLLIFEDGSSLTVHAAVG